MPFQAARSRTAMPLLEAMRYRVSPRLTTAVAPYLGFDGGATTALLPGSRMTRLEQPAMAKTVSAAAATHAAFDSRLDGSLWARRVMPLLPRRLRLPDQPGRGCSQQQHGDPADRLDVASQRRLGAHTAQPDRQRDQVHALAAADRHAGDERQQRH